MLKDLVTEQSLRVIYGTNGIYMFYWIIENSIKCITYVTFNLVKINRKIIIQDVKLYVYTHKITQKSIMVKAERYEANKSSSFFSGCSKNIFQR